MSEEASGGMYRMFKTDETLEKQGLLVEYGPFRVTLARAGGANKKYDRLMEVKAKPHLRAIQTKTIDMQVLKDLILDVYAEAVILNWEVKVGEEDGKAVYAQGIEGADGATLPFNKENVMATLKKLPDLFTDLQEQAGNAALFREDIREANSKNS